MFCPQCGTENPPAARFCSRCGEALPGIEPEGAPPLAAARPAPAAVAEYAGFWRRALAAIIDWILLSIPTGFINLMFGLSTFPFYGMDTGVDPDLAVGAAMVGFFWSSLISIAMTWIYYAAFESSKLQATPGKLAISIYVTDTAGRRISFARATGRYFAKFISAIILMIGYLMAAFTERKQALHDILADTLVVRK